MALTEREAEIITNSVHGVHDELRGHAALVRQLGEQVQSIQQQVQEARNMEVIRYAETRQLVLALRELHKEIVAYAKKHHGDDARELKESSRIVVDKAAQMLDGYEERGQGQGSGRGA